MTRVEPPARPVLLALAVGAAALSWDPLAPAATAKRTALLLVSIALLAPLAAGAVTRETNTARPTAVTAWLAWTGWAGISLLWGEPAGLGDASLWVAGAAIALASAKLDAESARRAARTASWTVGSVAGAATLVELARGARGLLLHGWMGNPNWLGLLLAVTLLPAIELARKARSYAAVALWVGVAAQGVALALSSSRVAWVALVVATLVRVARPPSGGASLARAAAAAALAVVALVGPPLRAAPVDLATDVPSVGHTVPWRDALRDRVWIWRVTGSAAASALPFGAGTGSFAREFLTEQGRQLAPLGVSGASRRFSNATTAHQDWLEALLERGVVGLLLLGAAFAVALRDLGRSGARDGVAALVALGVCALGDSPLVQPAIAALLGLWLGAARSTSTAPATRPALGRALAPALLVACGLCAAESTRGWLAARLVTEARDAEPAAALALLARAARIDAGSGEVALARGLLLQELGDADRAAPELRRSWERLANVGTLIALGGAQLARGDGRGARDSYLHALQLNPGSFRAHANLAATCASLGDAACGRAHFDVARSLWPGHPRLPEIEARVQHAEAEAGAR